MVLAMQKILMNFLLSNDVARDTRNAMPSVERVDQGIWVRSNAIDRSASEELSNGRIHFFNAFLH